MVGSIVADFESHEPSPLAPKEGFRGGHGGGRGYGGRGVGYGGHGGHGGRGYRSYGSGGSSGWGWWWPFPLVWPIWYDTEYIEYVPSYA